MGLIDWLFSKHEHRFLKQSPDRVWMTRADLYRGLIETFRQPAGNVLTIVVVHFPITATEFKAVFNGTMEFVEVVDETSLDALPATMPDGRPPVVLLRSDLIPKLRLPAMPTGLNELRILVLERHFLREKDDAVVAYGERFARPGEISFQMSLDDALLRVFIPSSITDLLRGSLDGEPWVESDMVGNSIKKAQERLQKKVVSSTSTDTPDEWLAANVTK